MFVTILTTIFQTTVMIFPFIFMIVWSVGGADILHNGTLGILQNKNVSKLNEKKKCDVIMFGNEFYDRKLMFHGYGKSYSMVMHEKTGDVYFSHVSRSDNLDNREIMACHVFELTCRSVEGISGGFAVVYDRNRDELFFGGNDGVYQYDFSVQIAKRIGAVGKAIYGIAIFQIYFYYIVYPEKLLYLVVNRDFENPIKVLPTQVEQILFTDSHFVYMFNSTALYKINPPLDKDAKFVPIDEQIHVRQIVKPLLGDVYLCSFEGIYSTKLLSHEVEKVCDIDKPFGMAFYRSVILYSDEKAIYSLILSNDKYCIGEAIENMDALRSSASLKIQLYV